MYDAQKYLPTNMSSTLNNRLQNLLRRNLKFNFFRIFYFDLAVVHSWDRYIILGAVHKLRPQLRGEGVVRPNAYACVWWEGVGTYAIINLFIGNFVCTFLNCFVLR